MIKAALIKVLKSKIISYIFSRDIISDFFIKDKLIVFLFHRDHNLNVDPEIFEHQVKLIKRNFNIISPGDLNDNTMKLSDNNAMITFDDGARGYFKNAVPICEKYKIPSIHFLNMAPINGEVFWSGLISYLYKYKNDFRADIDKQKKDLIELNESYVNDYLSSQNSSEIHKKAREYYGEFAINEDLISSSKSKYVFFGNHLYNHFNCTRLSEVNLQDQYTKNHKILKKYDNYLGFFSYPFGQKKTCYNKNTNLTIDKLGAKKIFTSNPINYEYKEKIVHRIPLKNDIKDINRLKSQIVLSRIHNLMRS